jgi:tetratricopeptide (TPR) repeat protein
MNGNPRALLREAIDLKRQKDYSRAWDIFASLAGDLRRSDFFWSNFAHLALIMDRTEEGIEFAREALNLRPGNTFARSIFAQLLSKAGREQDALDNFRIRLEQEFHVMDFKSMVRLAAETGSLDTAEAVYEQWQEAMKGDPEFFLIMAEGYRRSGRKEKATALYRQALNLDPDNAFTRRQALSVSLEGKSPSATIRELEMMLKLPDNKDNVHLMDLLAGQLKRKGRYEEAVDLFKRILTIRPDNLYYQKQLGFVFSKMGNHQAVIDLLVPCMEADPQDRFVSRTLVAALKRSGRKEEALRLMDRLIGRHPKVKGLYGLRKDIEKWPSGT